MLERRMLVLESYRTIKENGIHETEIKKSRFICNIQRTTTEKEAQDFIKEVKKIHADATHNCSAYQIGDHDEIQRAHDDGEPSGTAGVPMLEIFRKRELKNVAAVVTRYFGGKMLGAGGLIRAYSGAVNEAVNAVGVVERRLLQELRITTDYSSSGKVENELRQADLILQDIEYLQDVTFVCYLDLDKLDEIQSLAMDLTSGQGLVELGNKAYIEIDQDQ